MSIYKKPAKSKLLYKKDGTLDKRRGKPQSDLQLAVSTANWAIHFQLQHFSPYRLGHLLVSQETQELIRYHHTVVKELKQSITRDLAMTKMHILRKRKKQFDESK